MARHVLPGEINLSARPQLHLAGAASRKVKGHEVVDSAEGVGGVFPEGVWLRFYALWSGTVLAHLKGEILSRYSMGVGSPGIAHPPTLMEWYSPCQTEGRNIELGFKWAVESWDSPSPHPHGVVQSLPN